MRILIDAQPLLEPLAGIGRYAKSLLSAFAEKALDDDFYLFYGASLRPKRAKLPEFSNPRMHSKTVRLPGRFYRLITDKLPVLPPSSFVGGWDLYHGLNYHVPGGKSPSIVNIYDMSFMLYPRYFTPERLRDIGRKAAVSSARAGRIITGSISARRDIVELLGAPEEKVAVIYNGVGREFRPAGASAAEKFRRSKNLPEKFILFVGTIEPRKNLNVLARAFHELDLPGMSLVIAGGRGWLYDGLFEEIRRLNLGDRVLFTGYVPDEDLPGLYSCASVFVYPSVYEGFGFPPLEAMACGTPVITGNRSSLPEIVGDAGICVDPEDAGELAEAISGVLGDGGLRRRMSEKGVGRAAEFTWDKCASETYNLYREAAVKS